MLKQDKLYAMTSYARQLGLFNRLEEIYGRFPSTECNRCGECCFQPMPAYLLEYLYVYDYLKKNLAEEKWSTLLRKIIKYYFLELIDEHLYCPFLGEDKSCTIYRVRPLTCRIFGLVAVEVKSEERQQQIVAEVESYQKEHGVIIPETIVKFNRPTCSNVRITGKGKTVNKEDILRALGDVVDLEAGLLPQPLLEAEYDFLPLATHFALTFLSPGAIKRRPQIMKNVQSRGQDEMLERYLAAAGKIAL